MTIPEVKAVIGGDERLALLKSTMKKYIQELFVGDYGVDYVARRLEIGKAHENLASLPSTIYLPLINWRTFYEQLSITRMRSPMPLSEVPCTR